MKSTWSKKIKVICTDMKKKETSVIKSNMDEIRRSDVCDEARDESCNNRETDSTVCLQRVILVDELMVD